jgi:hypothetical protein
MYFLGHLEQVALTSLSLSFPICTQANHTCFAVWQWAVTEKMFVSGWVQTLAQGKHTVKGISTPMHPPRGGGDHASPAQPQLCPQFLHPAVLWLCQRMDTCVCLLGGACLLIHNHGSIVIRRPGTFANKLAVSRSRKASAVLGLWEGLSEETDRHTIELRAGIVTGGAGGVSARLHLQKGFPEDTKLDPPGKPLLWQQPGPQELIE